MRRSSYASLLVVLFFTVFPFPAFSKSNHLSIEKLIQNGQFSVADQKISRGLASGKSRSKWYRLKALLLYYSGSSASLAYANRAVKLNRKSAKALETVALISAALGKEDSALMWANELLKHDKDNQVAYAVLGHLQAKKRNIVKADQYFSKILNSDRPDFEALRMVASDLQHTSQLKRTIKAMNKLVESYPHSSLAFVTRGLFYRRTDSTALAKKDFEKACMLCPENGMATIMLGKIYRGQGNYEKALSYFTAYLKGHDNVATAYSKRADCYSHLGQYAKAVEDYSTSIGLLVPGSSFEIDMKKYSKASANIKRAYKMCWIQRAEAYAKNGDAPKAIAQLNTFLVHFPKDSSARYLRYKLFVKSKRYQKALSDIGFLIKQYPDISTFHKEQKLLFKTITQQNKKPTKDL